MTVTSYKPKGKFGSLDIDSDDNVKSFAEKPLGDGMWINAGFFVCQPEVFDFISDDMFELFEGIPLETLAEKEQMSAYKHYGFWRPMDTLRDNNELNQMWETGNAPWKIW